MNFHSPRTAELVWVAALVLGACNIAAPAAPSGTETAGGSSGTGTGGTDPDYMEKDECESSEDCESGEVCVAPYDSRAQPKRGQAVCVGGCVAALELDKYCFDDAACCDDLSCALDGLCEPPFEGETSSESGSESSSGSESGSESGTGSEGGGTGTTG